MIFNTAHLHPMLVHFPIALLSFGFLFELLFLMNKKEICFTKTGFYLLISATIMGVITILSGFLFTGEMQGAAGQVRETHESLALITIGLATATAILRIYIQRKKIEKSPLKTIAFLLYGAAVLAIMAAGFYGGTLVYNYMMPL